jgi:hypothetical protein
MTSTLCRGCSTVPAEVPHPAAASSARTGDSRRTTSVPVLISGWTLAVSVEFPAPAPPGHVGCVDPRSGPVATRHFDPVPQGTSSTRPGRVMGVTRSTQPAFYALAPGRAGRCDAALPAIHRLASELRRDRRRAGRVRSPGDRARPKWLSIWLAGGRCWSGACGCCQGGALGGRRGAREFASRDW